MDLVPDISSIGDWRIFCAYYADSGRPSELRQAGVNLATRYLLERLKNSDPLDFSLNPSDTTQLTGSDDPRLHAIVRAYILGMIRELSFDGKALGEGYAYLVGVIRQLSAEHGSEPERFAASSMGRDLIALRTSNAERERANFLDLLKVATGEDLEAIVTEVFADSSRDYADVLFVTRRILGRQPIQPDVVHPLAETIASGVVRIRRLWRV